MYICFQVCEEVIAEGGFGVVFLVRGKASSSGGPQNGGSGGGGGGGDASSSASSSDAPAAASSKHPKHSLFALKRMFVNNDRDLAVCKREISIASNLNGHRHLIGHVDSSVTLRDGGVHEVLLLMPYHRTTLLQLMNERLHSAR